MFHKSWFFFLVFFVVVLSASTNGFLRVCIIWARQFYIVGYHPVCGEYQQYPSPLPSRCQQHPHPPIVTTINHSRHCQTSQAGGARRQNLGLKIADLKQCLVQWALNKYLLHEKKYKWIKSVFLESKVCLLNSRTITTEKLNAKRTFSNRKVLFLFRASNLSSFIHLYLLNTLSENSSHLFSFWLFLLPMLITMKSENDHQRTL